ncbi:MAG: hypothetical protein NT133_17060, partial [Alphaproteobacteria bacterium]|nr:hypothetical protein [Alphaproteobacteria bacterium]
MSETSNKPRFSLLEGTEPTLIWQYDNAARWEGQWIRELLPQAAQREYFEYRRYETLSRNMYVVDNRLKPEYTPYFEEARRLGCRVVLLHFGDGGFRDDLSVYGYCTEVWRNHWSADIAALPRVRYLPLG